MTVMVEGAAHQKNTRRDCAENSAVGPYPDFPAGDRLPLVLRLVCCQRRWTGALAPATSLFALSSALLPTKIGALFSALGIAGMNRLNRTNVLAASDGAIEFAGNVDVLLLDKP